MSKHCRSMQPGSVFRMALATVFVAASLIATSAQAENRKLKLCYTTWGQHGGEGLPGKGFIPDLIRRVFEHAKYEVTIEIVPWPRCINVAKRKGYDMVASGWRGKNFDPFFDYLNIVTRNDISFIVRKDSDIGSGDLQNFEGRKVAYVRDSGGMDPIRQNKKIDAKEVNKMTSMVPMLHGKRIDAVVTDPDSFFLAAAKMNPPLDKEFKVLDPPVFTNFNSPLVPKGHPQFAQIKADFDKAYKELVKQGLYKKLIEVHGTQFTYQIPLHAR